MIPYYIFIISFFFMFLLSMPPVTATVITGSCSVSALDCKGNTINLGKLAVKSEAKEAMVGYRSTTVAGLRLDIANLPGCCPELNFMNVVIQDASPPAWEDENGNSHQLSVPYIDPPWNWDPGGVPKADNKPFYDGQVRNKKASEAGGIAGSDFALDDMLKTPSNPDPILSLVFGDMPKFSDSIKFATLLMCVDENVKKISVIKSFTWGAKITGQGITATVDTLPIIFSDGLPSELNRANLQSALDKSGFGADIKVNNVLQHKGEGWRLSEPSDCVPCKPIPEPSTLLLFGSGLAAFLWFGRKRLGNKS